MPHRPPRNNPTRSISAMMAKYLCEPDAADLANKPHRCSVLCQICGSKFISDSHWQFAKWNYANVCDACRDWPAEGGRCVPKEFWTKVSDALPKSCECPRCGVVTTVKPEMRGGTWEYELICPQCTASSYARCRLRCLCDQCHKMFDVDEWRPTLICIACEKPKEKKKGKGKSKAY